MRVPLIDNNPLRVLGVFSNATLREIEQNKAQLRAYARVGQEAQLPLWLNGASIFPQLPDITEDMLAEAEAELTLQDDCNRYAIFWFERDSGHANEDQEACTLLNENRVDEARQLWLQRTDHAAQKNLLLLAVVGDNWSEIATRASKCFEGEMAEFRTFMSEVVKYSPDANDSQSHQLLDHFTEDPWMTDVKRLLENHHKSHLDEIIDRLEHSGITDEKLLRYEVDEALDELVHLDALKILMGSKSVVYTFYATETSKLLSDIIKGYYNSYPCEFSSEWADYRFDLLLRHFDDYGSAYNTVTAAREEIQRRAYLSKPTNSESDGCAGCSLLPVIILLVLISKIVNYCDSNHHSYSHNKNLPELPKEVLEPIFQKLHDINENQQIIEDERLQIEITEDNLEQSSAPRTEDIVMPEKPELGDLKKRDSLIRVVLESAEQDIHKDPLE